MRLAFLILAALALPFGWGWAMTWLLARIWPEREPVPEKPVPSTPPPIFPDFQI
jgi:hypothetical protein